MKKPDTENQIEHDEVKWHSVVKVSSTHIENQLIIKREYGIRNNHIAYDL